jgi:hypothetical protein
MTLTLIVLGLGALYVLPNRRTAFRRSQVFTLPYLPPPVLRRRCGS